mgnify:CR=1 FL=1
MNIYEKLLNNQRKYLSDKGTIDVNTRIENLKKLKKNIKKYDVVHAVDIPKSNIPVMYIQESFFNFRPSFFKKIFVKIIVIPMHIGNVIPEIFSYNDTVKIIPYVLLLLVTYNLWR